jgi:hypothetical protein
VLTLAFCFAAAVVCFAASDAQMGTWKLNEAKSKIGAGAPKNNTVIVEAAGDNIKVTLEGMAPNGSATHVEWTGKFDGKDYPSTGNPNEDMRAYTPLSDRALHFESKKSGKVMLSGHVEISANGKVRTVTANGTTPDGKKFRITAIYDKQ